jgi:hypothetical protein
MAPFAKRTLAAVILKGAPLSSANTGRCQPGLDWLRNQVPFDFCERREDAEHQLARRRHGVDRCAMACEQLRTEVARAAVVDDVDEMAPERQAENRTQQVHPRPGVGRISPANDIQDDLDWHQCRGLSHYPDKSGGCALNDGGQYYRGRSVRRHGTGTEGAAIHSEGAAELSRVHSSSARDEGLNDENA